MPHLDQQPIGAARPAEAQKRTACSELKLGRLGLHIICRRGKAPREARARPNAENQRPSKASTDVQAVQERENRERREELALPKGSGKGRGTSGPWEKRLKALAVHNSERWGQAENERLLSWGGCPCERQRRERGAA